MPPVLNNSVLYRMHIFCNYYMLFNVVFIKTNCTSYRLIDLVRINRMYNKLKHYYRTTLLPSHCA